MLINDKTDEDQLNTQIGQTIRTLRKAAGMTQADLGNAIGVRFQQIQKYETGTNRVTASRLKRIADVLDVSVVALYGDMSDSTLSRSVLKPPADMTMDEAQSYLTMLSALPESFRVNFLELLQAYSRK